MKKIILAAAFIISAFAHAQVISATGNNQPITEGQTFTFNSTVQAQANLSLKVTNLTNQNIYIKLKVNSITNADGTDVQFCFGGLCYFSISEGSTVPNNNTLSAITPGGTNGNDDHFYNQNAGNVAGEDVIYNLSFIQVTSAGEETETLLTFSYKYSATAGVSDFDVLKNAGIALNSTVVNSQLNLNANNAATLNLYNVNGQLVKTTAIAQGDQSVDVSSIASGVYVASFTTKDGKKGSVKIVKN